MSVDIAELLRETTTMFRKGPEVVDHPPDKAGIAVTEVFGMPHESDAAPALAMFDLHFLKVGVQPLMAEHRRGDLIEWLREYPEPERLAGGPSYIEIGAVLGSQDFAMCLFALGAHLKLWTIITPETLHLEGADADRAAGQGFVMMSGWKPE